MNRFRPLLSAIGVVAASQLSAQTRDSAGVRIVTSTKPRWTDATRLRVDAVPIFSVGSNSAVAQEQFSTVMGAGRLSDGSVVVSDRKALELRLFDSHGKFVRTIGQKGEGPGDFQGAITLFVTVGDTIVTWDFRASRFTYFNVAGHVLQTVAIDRPARQVGPEGRSFGATRTMTGRFTDGTFLSTRAQRIKVNPPTGMYLDSVIVSRIRAPAATDVKTLLGSESWTYDRSGGSSGDFRPFGRSGSVAVASAAFFESDGSSYDIREYTPDGKLVRVLRLKRVLTPVTATDIRGNKAAEIASAPEKYRKLQGEIEDWMAFPTNMPAYDTLAVDAAGRVWARLFADSKAPPRWEVFAPDGAYLGAVRLPAVMDVLQIGRDYLLARVKNADDVEMVNVYRLH